MTNLKVEYLPGIKAFSERDFIHNTSTNELAIIYKTTTNGVHYCLLNASEDETHVQNNFLKENVEALNWEIIPTMEIKCVSHKETAKQMNDDDAREYAEATQQQEDEADERWDHEHRDEVESELT